MTGIGEQREDLFDIGLVNQELDGNNRGTRKFHLNIVLKKHTKRDSNI
jgi:hypothetical protein